MTIEISSENLRSIKAIQIAASAGQWMKCRTTAGSKAYGIRSSRDANHVYLVTCSTCTCQDAARHPGKPCKHQLAVRLHVELTKAGALPRPARDVVDGLAAMVIERQGSVLDMVRHADGDITWERHQHVNGEAFHMPRRQAADPTTAALAQRYSDIFSQFEGD